MKENDTPPSALSLQVGAYKITREPCRMLQVSLESPALSNGIGISNSASSLGLPQVKIDFGRAIKSSIIRCVKNSPSDEMISTREKS